MQRRVNENPNIEILFETQAEGLFGENGVEGVHLVKGKDTAHEERYDLPIDGFSLPLDTNLIQIYSNIPLPSMKTDI